MLIINIIESKYESSTKNFLFTLFLNNKSFITENFAIFKDLNIKYMGFDKTDT